MHALRAFRDPASFPVLAEALDDSERDVRYNAVVTQCMAINAPDMVMSVGTVVRRRRAEVHQAGACLVDVATLIFARKHRNEANSAGLRESVRLRRLTRRA